ncbi:MAG: nicotinate-nucleotide adenylyltransferase [Hyphomicrobiaceae bacterium]
MSLKSAPVRFGSVKPKPPLVGPGQRIGLLGGSFNPPHEAHRSITWTARRRLGLDAVWWVVTPGNPLKSRGELAPLDERLRLCRQLVGNPKVKITAFETDLPSAYTAASLAHLKLRFPSVRFVWLMGADNLATFHLWQDWQEIARQMPIAVVDRPGWRLPSLARKAAHFMRRSFVPEHRAKGLATMPPPAWTFLTGRLSSLSSTEIRNSRMQLMNVLKSQQ